MPGRARQTCAAQAGFTLPELLVVLVLTGMLSSFFLSCFFTVTEQYRMRSARLELEDNLSLALSCLTEEIAKSTAVLTCDSDRLTLRQGNVIYYTLEDDPQQEEHFYRLEGKNLYRRENTEENIQPMANFIKEMTFSYLDEAGAPVTEPQKVRAVAVTLAGEWQGGRTERRVAVRLARTAYL